MLLCGAACSNVESVPLGICGNHIVEDTEDCDSAEKNCSSSCHFSCSANKGDLCPPGYGCDLGAGQCRGASGTFTHDGVLGNSQNFPVVADFDGDQRDDLLIAGSDGFRSSPSAIYFFDPGASTHTVVSLPQAQLAATFDVTGDGRSDVVLGGSSLLAYESRPGRQFSPLLSSSRGVASDTRLFSADFDCDGRREFAYLQGNTLSILRSERTFAAQPELDLGTSEILSPFAVSWFRNAAGQRCELLVLFEKARSRMHVYGNAGADPDQGVQLLSTIDLLGPAAPPATLFAADFDLDGHPDLIVEPQPAAFGDPPNGAYIAYGVGDGSFDSSPHPTSLAPGNGTARPLVDCDCSGLAVGQFDNDPSLDFFDGVVRLGGGAFQFYDHARVADLTGDGRDDVAAVLQGSGMHDFDLLRSNPSGILSPLVVATNGQPLLRDSADFDGDGQTDLLITEALESKPEASVLSVLFGAVTPDTARVHELAQLPRIQDAAAGYLEGDSGVVDAFADVAVLHESKSGNLQLGFFEGGIDRLLRSPLSAKSEEGTLLTAHRPAIGHFRAGHDAELAVLANEAFGSGATSVELYSLDSSGAASVGTAHLSQGVSGSRLAVADLNRDGQDELYLLQVAGPVFALTFTGGGLAPLRIEEQAYTFGPNTPFSMSVADIDADGYPDLSLPSGTFVTVLLATDGDVPRSYTVDFPSELCSVPRASAWIQADTDPALELVVNCLSDGVDDIADSRPVLRVLDVDLASGGIVPIGERQAGLDSSELAVGDFNGDGVQDLAAANGDVAILLGKAR